MFDCTLGTSISFVCFMKFCKNVICDYGHIDFPEMVVAVENAIPSLTGWAAISVCRQVNSSPCWHCVVVVVVAVVFMANVLPSWRPRSHGGVEGISGQGLPREYCNRFLIYVCYNIQISLYSPS